MRAPSYVSAGTIAVESSAWAPAIETASSSSGVSPLVPIAPTTSPSTTSGMPPVSATAPCSASAPSLPPLKVFYIGSVENKAGVKVAVLITDRKEILTGQAGQVVANRYRIARIGLESVDLEDVGSGQSRRVPLKGN